MLEIYSFADSLLADNLSGADVGAHIAVVALCGVGNCKVAIHGDGAVGAVVSTVAAAGTCAVANLALELERSLGRAGNNLGSLIGNERDNVVGADMYAVAAANALGGVNYGNTVYNMDSVIAAYDLALAETEAAGGAETALILQLDSFCAAGNTLGSQLAVVLAAGAANESNVILDLGEVVESVNNDLLLADDGAGYAADALGIINNSMVINKADSAAGAVVNALAAGNAAPCADITHGFLFLLTVGAGDKVGCIFGNEADKLLGASCNAVAAAVALFAVNGYNTVFALESAVLAGADTGAGTNTAVFALSGSEAFFDGFSTGRCVGMSFCRKTCAGNEGLLADLIYALSMTQLNHILLS